jgi:RNA polymerase sigma factor (sigma-70 family)
MDDADLVSRARQGDRDAYTQLVERYRDAIYGLAFHELHDFEDARDVAQEAFIQAYLHLDQLRDPERFGPWLRQVTVNRCRSWRRGQWRETARAEPPEPAVSSGSVETRLAVQQALSAPSDMLMEAEAPRGMLYGVAFSPDGTRIATGSSIVEDEVISGGEIVLWDARTHRAVQTIKVGASYVKSVAFTPDGMTLAAGCTQVQARPEGGWSMVASEVRLWNPTDGTEQGALARLEAAACIQRVQFSPDGRRLVVDRYRDSGSRDAEVWDVASGQRLHAFSGSGEGQGVAAYSADGKTLASAGAGDRIDIWRLA